MTFKADKAMVRAGSIPEVIASLRIAAISLMRLTGAPNTAVCRRYEDLLWPLLALIQQNE